MNYNIQIEIILSKNEQYSLHVTVTLVANTVLGT